DRAEAREMICKELGISPKSPIVLMVGTQSKVKNYPMFLRAAAHVEKRRPDAVFVGVGRKHDDDSIEETSRQLGCNNVRLVGEKRDVAPWCAAADVFCLTSYFEGMPNALLEGMVAGLPVICTSFSSSKEIINDGANGLLVPVDDDRALGAAVLRLLGSPDLRADLGRRGRSRIISDFSWDIVVNMLEALYDGRQPCGIG
ncbi:MAG: glycosyltransferase family 4 protein, partial [Thermoanaerobaculales bacterium]|nr:glycosyltransferase family 4 protein [Thermoanaerobaculales bacterium]